MFFLTVLVLLNSFFTSNAVQPFKIDEPVTGKFESKQISKEYKISINKTANVGFSLFCHTDGSPSDISWKISFFSEGGYSPVFLSTGTDFQKNKKQSKDSAEWYKENLTLPTGNYTVTVSVPEKLFNDEISYIDYLFEIYPFEKASSLSYADKPSAWAQKEVESALKSNLVPAELSSKFTANITRAEFARLVSYYVVKNISGTPDATIHAMDNWLEDSNFYRLHGIEKKSFVFADTNDKYINFAYSTGVVAGVGEGNFNPNGVITREQAAVMLTNASFTSSNKINIGAKIIFNDKSDFSDWAKDAIDFITSVRTYEKSVAVMSGVENGNFAPKEKYTREQAIVTVYRLLQSTFSNVAV